MCLKKVQASAEGVNFLGQTDLPLSKKVGLAVMLRKLCVSRTEFKIKSQYKTSNKYLEMVQMKISCMKELKS
jgi:hypothetical protein